MNFKKFAQYDFLSTFLPKSLYLENDAIEKAKRFEFLRKQTFNPQSAARVARQQEEPRGKIKNSWQTKVIFQILPQQNFNEACKRRRVTQSVKHLFIAISSNL